MLQSTGQEMREQPHSQAAQQWAEPGSLAKPGFLPLIRNHSQMSPRLPAICELLVSFGEAA